jgi:hypothetical protein
MYVSTMAPAGFNGGRGLGDAASAAQQVQIGGSMAAGTASAILGSLTAGGATAVLGITAAAVPVIGAALVAATLLVSYLVKNSGCGITCVETSSWANQAAAALQKVMDAYFALPAPRTQAQQAVAIANFHAIWQQLEQLCGQPGTGNAGVRCISDRQAGACTWKQKYAPVYPGQPNIGECWNWWNGYLQPIQQDPVVPDPSPADVLSSAASSVSGSIASVFQNADGSTSMLPLLVLGGLALWAVTK